MGKRVGGRRSVHRRSICSSITVHTVKKNNYQQTMDEVCYVMFTSIVLLPDGRQTTPASSLPQQ